MNVEWWKMPNKNRTKLCLTHSLNFACTCFCLMFPRLWDTILISNRVFVRQHSFKQRTRGPSIWKKCCDIPPKPKHLSASASNRNRFRYVWHSGTKHISIRTKHLHFKALFVISPRGDISSFFCWQYSELFRFSFAFINC